MPKQPKLCAALHVTRLFARARSRRKALPGAASPNATVLGSSPARTDRSDGPAVARLKATLRWRGEEEEAVWCKATGSSLLFWASTASNLAAVRELVDVDSTGTSRGSVRRDLARGVTRDWSEFTIMKGCNPLMAAMCFASAEVVETLIDADPPNPKARVGFAYDAPMLAAIFSNSGKKIRLWLRKYPGWDLERRSSLEGQTTLLSGVATSSDVAADVADFAACGAQLDARGYFGGSLLHYAAYNVNTREEDVRRLAALPEVRGTVNAQAFATNCQGRAMVGFCRLARRRRNGTDQFVNMTATENGNTPLHEALSMGNISTARAIVEHLNPDLALRNSDGFTALGVARVFYNGGMTTPGVTLAERVRMAAEARAPAVVEAMLGGTSPA